MSTMTRRHVHLTGRKPPPPPAVGDAAAQDVLRGVEDELAGHPVFGDARGILDRAHTYSLLRLEALSRGRPLIRALCRALREERNREAAGDVLADPVVLHGIRGLLEESRQGAAPRLGESEDLGGSADPDGSGDVFAAVLEHLRSGTPGLPLAARCPLYFHPDVSTAPIALWDPDVPDSIVKRRFECIYHGDVAATTCFLDRRQPEPACVDTLGRGYDLLATVLPALAPSVLAHVRLILVIGGKHFRSMSVPYTPSIVFLSTRTKAGALRTPWKLADMLLHESAHLKLMNMEISRPIVLLSHRRTGRPPATIRAIWRQDAPEFPADWPLQKAFHAFYVYVHLALFYACAESMEAPLTGTFGPPPASRERKLRTSLDRARYLGRELAAVDRHLGLDGRTLRAWLSVLLSRFS